VAVEAGVFCTACCCWFVEFVVEVGGAENICCSTLGVGVLGMTRSCCCCVVEGAVVLVGGTVVGVAGTAVDVAGCCCVVPVVGVDVGGTGVDVAGAVVDVGGTVVACVTGVAAQGPCVAPVTRASIAVASFAGRVRVWPLMQIVIVCGVWAEARPVVAVSDPIATVRPRTATTDTLSRCPNLLLGRCERRLVAWWSIPSPP